MQDTKEGYYVARIMQILLYYSLSMKHSMKRNWIQKTLTSSQQQVFTVIDQGKNQIEVAAICHGILHSRQNLYMMNNIDAQNTKTTYNRVCNYVLN